MSPAKIASRTHSLLSLRGSSLGALSLGLVIALGASAARGDNAEDAMLARVAGCHRFAGGDQERKALDAAIERIVDEFSFVLRPIVRSRLKDANPVIRQVCLRRHDNRVTVSLDDRKYTAPLDGKPVKVTGITGDELDLRVKIGKTALWQAFEGEDGSRVNGYTPRDRGRLVLKVRVVSERLPQDLIYQLTYRHD